MTSLLKEGGLSAAEVNKALGLDESIDILTFNPFAEGVDANQALAVEKLATKVVAVVNSYAKVLQELGTDVSETKAFEQALVAVVEVVKEKSSNTSVLDLTKSDDLTKIKDKVIAKLDDKTAADNKTLIENVTTAIENVTDEIDTVTALDDASKDVFKISQQLANQVATSVKDPSKTIAFTETGKVDASVNNKAPTAMTLSANSITDGAGNLQIGTLSITDPDDPKPVPIWKIAKLADHGDFEISADGNLTLKSSPDLAAKASYSVTIVATDTGGATITKTFTITVKAAEGAVVTLSNNKVAENHAGAEFGTLSGAASYKLAAANDDRNVNKYVEIVEIDGVFTLKLKDENKADYETNQSGGRVDIIATAADGKESEHSFSIFPTDVDEAPEAIALDGSTLREGEAGQVIGKFSATDPEGERLTFKLAAEAGNNDNDLYEIVDGSTLKLKDGERLEADEEDFDQPDVVVVEVSDGTKTTTKSFNISFANNDTVERATTLTDGVEITGKISDASDVDIFKFTVQAGQAVRYVFTDGDNDSATHKINVWGADEPEDPADAADGNEVTTPYYLDVDPGTYYLSVKSDADFDDYSLRVDTTTDSIQLSNKTVFENAAGAVIGTLNGAVSYELAASNNENSNHLVEIVEMAGVYTVKLKDGLAADYENDEYVDIDIIATDTAGIKTTYGLEVDVTDVDEASEAIALDGSTLREGEAGQVIGKFSATDPEGERLTFKLAAEAGNNDNDLYEIVDGSTLKLKDGERLEADEEDFDQPDVVVVEVSDGTNTTTKSFNISFANNDTVERATTLADGVEITGKISNASDVDIFKIALGVGQNLEMTFADGADNSATHAISLIDPNGAKTEIAATVNDLTKTPILTDAAAGDYYIQIESAADFADYTLMLDVA